MKNKKMEKLQMSGELKPEKKEKFSDEELIPGGYYNPRGVEIKIGEHVENLLEQSPNPEMLTYAKALLKDMVEDYKLMGRQISEGINKKIQDLQKYIDKINKKEKSI